MLTENDVVNIVAAYLVSKGYKVDQALTTNQQGIDIEATSNKGMKCYVEAKGATSSKPGTNRFGDEFTVSQIKSHVGVALVKAFQTLQEHPDGEVVIALPGNTRHRKIIDSMRIPIRDSGIKVYLVEGNGNIDEHI